jgi:hypothetical protein
MLGVRIDPEKDRAIITIIGRQGMNLFERVPSSVSFTH